MDKRIQAQMAKMDQQQELLLARLLTEEAQQLTERAKTNKRVEEDELWEQRTLQRAREAQSRQDHHGQGTQQQRVSSPPATSSASRQGPHAPSPPAAAAGPPAAGLDEGDVHSWLAARRVRGRGGVGSLADDVGPWIEEADGLPARVVGDRGGGKAGDGGGGAAASPTEQRLAKEKKKKKKNKERTDKEKKKKKKRRRASSMSDSYDIV